MNAVVRGFTDVLSRAVQKSPGAFIPIARTVFTNLRNTNENELTAVWLRDHVFNLGLFGQDQRNGERAFFDKDAVTAIVRDMNAELRALHLMGKLVPCRWDLQPVYTMVDSGAWDEPCRNALAHELERDEAADGMALMYFGAHYTTDASTIEAISGLGVFVAACQRRLSRGETMHESVRLAHEKAIQEVGHRVGDISLIRS
jgi:hypothetical protein